MLPTISPPPPSQVNEIKTLFPGNSNSTSAIATTAGDFSISAEEASPLVLATLAGRQSGVSPATIPMNLDMASATAPHPRPSLPADKQISTLLALVEAGVISNFKYSPQALAHLTALTVPWWSRHLCSSFLACTTPSWTPPPSAAPLSTSTSHAAHCLVKNLRTTFFLNFSVTATRLLPSNADHPRDTLGSFVYVPCEVMKQRMQVQGTKTSWSSMISNKKSGSQMYGCYSGMFQAGGSILKEQGPRGLYAGFWSTLARDVSFAGLMVMFYEASKGLTEYGKHKWWPHADSYVSSSLKGFLLGGVSGGMFFCVLGFSAYLTTPLDVIKTRLQVQGPKIRYNGWLDAITRIWRGRRYKRSVQG